MTRFILKNSKIVSNAKNFILIEKSQYTAFYFKESKDYVIKPR